MTSFADMPVWDVSSLIVMGGVGGCPVCYSRAVGFAFCAGYRPDVARFCLPTSAAEPVRVDGAHMHRQCSTCGFEWLERIDSSLEYDALKSSLCYGCRAAPGSKHADDCPVYLQLLKGSTA